MFTCSGSRDTGKSFSDALLLLLIMTRECSLNSPKNTSSEHVVYKISFLFMFWHSKQYLYTTCSELVCFREFNEQSLIILWVNWFKNKSFWHRFTCTSLTHAYQDSNRLLIEVHLRTKKNCYKMQFLRKSDSISLIRDFYLICHYITNYWS